LRSFGRAWHGVCKRGFIRFRAASRAGTEERQSVGAGQEEVPEFTRSGLNRLKLLAENEVRAEKQFGIEP
jgi:hypothetical protein